jgi:hypothetical protein
MTRPGKLEQDVLRNFEPQQPGPAPRSGAEQGLSHVWKRRYYRSYPVGLARRSNRHRRLQSEDPPPGETPTGSCGSREGFEPTGGTQPGRPPERTPPPRHPMRRNRSKAPRPTGRPRQRRSGSRAQADLEGTRPEATISPKCSGTDARPEPQGTRPKALRQVGTTTRRSPPGTGTRTLMGFVVMAANPMSGSKATVPGPNEPPHHGAPAREIPGHALDSAEGPGSGPIWTPPSQAFRPMVRLQRPCRPTPSSGEEEVGPTEPVRTAPGERPSTQ